MVIVRANSLIYITSSRRLVHNGMQNEIDVAGQLGRHLYMRLMFMCMEHVEQEDFIFLFIPYLLKS
jgi:hypothetical protein